MAATGFEVTLEMLKYRYRLDACYPITRTKLGSDTDILFWFKLSTQIYLLDFRVAFVLGFLE